MTHWVNIDKWTIDGFVFIKGLITKDELISMRLLCNEFLEGKFNIKGLRSDLSGGNRIDGKERITQIMQPSTVQPSLVESDVYKKVNLVASKLIGEDAVLDFDMIINKLPHTETATPWHQDAAYWPAMEDTRSCSFWIALDRADLDNGCMQYISGSHNRPLQGHKFVNEGGALETQLSDTDDVVNGLLDAGSAIVHHGFTLHGALGNFSDRNRRAWILNYRPLKMVNYLRSMGYDHTGKRKQNENV